MQIIKFCAINTLSKGTVMKLIFKSGKVEIWQTAEGFYVYGVTSDPRVLPSLDMERAFAAGV